MSDNATPKTRVRAKRYPAALPRTMVSDEMRADVDAHADAEGLGMGAAVRDLVKRGLATLD